MSNLETIKLLIILPNEDQLVWILYWFNSSSGQLKKIIFSLHAQVSSWTFIEEYIRLKSSLLQITKYSMAFLGLDLSWSENAFTFDSNESNSSLLLPCHSSSIEFLLSGPSVGFWVSWMDSPGVDLYLQRSWSSCKYSFLDTNISFLSSTSLRVNYF